MSRGRWHCALGIQRGEAELATEAEEVHLGMRDGGVLERGQQEILQHLGRACRVTLQTGCRFSI